MIPPNGTDAARPLGVAGQTSPKIVTSFFHHLCREKGQMIKFQDVKRSVTLSYGIGDQAQDHTGQALRFKDEVSSKKHQDLADGLQVLDEAT
jgi:hypothetical protein